MNYPETLEFLFSQLPMYQRIGAAAYKSNLDTTLSLCKKLKNPERSFPSVHIAGTNGKGSVAHMLASILQEAGYKTGLYTSPHLKDFRERIRVDGRMIPEEAVVRFVEKGKKLFGTLQPSFFEYTFGMAMDWFRENRIDVAVVETGMGGRLDSTNVVEPVVTAITNIGLDHTRFLGDTLEKVAGEKAGIIKNGVPVVVGSTQVETEKLFRQTAASFHAPICFADQELEVEPATGNTSPYPGGQSFWMKDKTTGEKIRLTVSLAGLYQRQNARTAWVCVDQLKQAGYRIADSHAREGFERIGQNTGILGRWQVLGTNPLVVCDTGHNADGIRKVVDQIASMTFNQLHMVVGMVEDKNLDNVLALFPKEATYYFCKANIPRGLDQDLLKEQCRKAGLTGDSYPSVREAYRSARAHAHEEDMIFVGGSTFVVAEVL